jgi:hypothetical protein
MIARRRFGKALDSGNATPLRFIRSSMANIAYLFPDTNVFVQCRPLEELDWSSWRELDEVHLVVSRPIESEIDAHKNRGTACAAGGRHWDCSVRLS